MKQSRGCFNQSQNTLQYNKSAICETAQAQLSCKIHSTYPSVRLLWLLDTRACCINCRLLISFRPVEMEDENIDPSTSTVLNRLIYTNSSNPIMLIFSHFQNVFDNKVSRGGFERKKYDVRKKML